MSTSSAQLQRLLSMVPYLIGHDGAKLADLAEQYGVSEKQIVADLNVLWYCGLPGLQMGDLIDIDFEAVKDEGVVRLSNAEYLNRPLQLTADEALSLLTGLRTLADSATGDEQRVVESAIGKLEAAAGAGAEAHVYVEPADSELLANLTKALRDGVAVHLSYDVPARDETTERDVDPMQLIVADGRHYLEAWCRSAHGVRLFRLDRIAAARALDEPSRPPAEAQPRDPATATFTTAPEHQRVTLELDAAAAWVADYYPVESNRKVRGTELRRVTMAVADPAFLDRLLLRLGGHARVTDPPDWQPRVAERAAAALAAYEA